MARKEVGFAYCKTEDMKADILTKALAPGKFKKCKKEIGIAEVIRVWGSVEFRAFRDSVSLGFRIPTSTCVRRDLGIRIRWSKCARVTALHPKTYCYNRRYEIGSILGRTRTKTVEIL